MYAFFVSLTPNGSATLSNIEFPLFSKYKYIYKYIYIFIYSFCMPETDGKK